MKSIDLRSVLPLAVAALLMGWLPTAMAQTQCMPGSTCVTTNGGSDALSKQEARQMGEQWDDSRGLRKKVNTRVEKEFDKVDNAIDNQERCQTSQNLNAYWEPNTLRCLDRKTGRAINP